MPPWCNPWLLVACGVSFGLHFLILYVPLLADVSSSALMQVWSCRGCSLIPIHSCCLQVFSIVPLSVTEWCLVLLFAFPVILIDEVLKFIGELVLHPRLWLQPVYCNCVVPLLCREAFHHT